MQHSFKAEKLEHDSYLENKNPYDQNALNVEINDTLFGLKIINNSNCVNNQLLSISPGSNISDLFSQSSNTINEDYKSNGNSLHDDILTSSQGIILNQSNDIDVNSNLGNNILFQRQLINNFNTNTAYLPIHIPQNLVALQSCNNNNYMQYSNSYQYNNSCANTISIPNVSPAQFIQCPQPITNQNNVNDLSTNFDPILKDSYSLNSKTDTYNDEHKRLERKRARNREAARKCRERKTQHVEVLEVKLQEQKNAIDLMQNKMKLVLSEMRKLGDYISKNIPQSDLREFKRIENDIAICLEMAESES